MRKIFKDKIDHELEKAAKLIAKKYCFLTGARMREAVLDFKAGATFERERQIRLRKKRIAERQKGGESNDQTNGKDATGSGVD